MEDFGETERLEPDEARQYISDLIYGMRERTFWINEFGDKDLTRPRGEEGPSMTQQCYGDVWKLILGIDRGMTLMHRNSRNTADGVIVKEEAWEEEYDQYGYGIYGDGLEIGKRLAFYSDNDFEFVEPDDDSEPDFNFVE